VLEYIRINNFRSHKNTFIEFSDSITVITGESMSGKTNIRRALRWLSDHRPVGPKLVSNFARDEPTSVEIGIDGHKVSIVRPPGKSSTSYTIDYPNGWRYSADFTGTDVPEKVNELLNFSSASVQLSQIKDMHYLVGSKNSDLRNEINRLSDIEEVNSWLRLAESDLRATRKRQEELRAEVSSHSDTVAALAGIGPAEELVVGAKVLQGKINDLSGQLNELTELDRYAQGYMKHVRLGPLVDEAEAALDAANALNRQVANSSAMIEYLSFLLDQEKRIRSMEAGVSSADSAIADAEKISKQAESMSDISEEITKLLDRQYELEQHSVDAANTLAEYISSLESSRVCPTCYGKIDKQAINRIISTYREQGYD
jgi:DNA repair exonuclease SbcCD ATPase subunit